MLERVRGHGATRLVVAGMMTHMCVDATVRAALTWALLAVPADACATRNLTFDGRERGRSRRAGRIFGRFKRGLRHRGPGRRDDAVTARLYRIGGGCLRRPGIILTPEGYAALYFAEDVTVPISAIADLVNALPNYESRYQLEIFAFGHAGDGNIHLNITTQDPHKEEQALAGAVQALLRSWFLALGGTISGEHGIGPCEKGLHRQRELPQSMPRPVKDR